MIIFLTSSPTGPLDGSRPVDGLDKMNNFVVNLRKYWKPDSRCLMIAAAPDEPARNDEMCEFIACVINVVVSYLFPNESLQVFYERKICLFPLLICGIEEPQIFRKKH